MKSILIVLQFSLLAGCHLFESSNPNTADEKPPNIALKDSPTGMQRIGGAVKLEMYFVERSLNDPLLRDNGLWSEVGMVGPVRETENNTLLDLGFRVGHVGSVPPASLEKILGVTSNGFRSQTNDLKNVISSSVTLIADQDTEIQTSPIYPTCRIEVPSVSGSRHREFSNTRCLLKMKAIGNKKGWATVTFTPEIHHNKMKWRQVPAKTGGWTGRTMQDVESLFDHRFSVTLNMGEMVVIGADTEAQTSLGRHFFIGADENARTQRLIVLRLVDMPEVKVESQPYQSNW